jgi:hypothetical protein
MQVPLLVENHKVRARTENRHGNQSIIKLHHHLSSYYLTSINPSSFWPSFGWLDGYFRIFELSGWIEETSIQPSSHQAIKPAGFLTSLASTKDGEETIRFDLGTLP